MIDYVALKAECQTNPNAYSQDGKTLTEWYDAGNDQMCADILNAIRTAIVVNKGFILPSELANAIVYSEYQGGAATPRQYIDMLMTLDRIDTSPGSNPRTGLLAIFGAATVTRSNLVAAAQRTGSRAEQLFGTNTILSAGDVYTTR